MINLKLIIFFGLIFCLTNCTEQSKQKLNAPEQIGGDLAQLELKDSSILIHIKGQFYKSQAGQLFERSFADREVNGVDSLVSIEYFNGKLPQVIDPFTFEQLDGWFAKDKNFAYYYRPTSGGMLIAKLDSANVKTFKVLEGHYKYAVDKNHVFCETSICENLNPSILKIIRNDQNRIVKLISDKTIYIVQPD
jgi:hypothetical protein